MEKKEAANNESTARLWPIEPKIRKQDVSRKHNKIELTDYVIA